MEKLSTDKNTLKKFGYTMAIAFGIIAALLFFRGKETYRFFCVIAAFFLAGAAFLPSPLKFFYIPWMKFAFLLGWINTRIILCIVFYLILTPIGLIMRLFRDPLDRKIDKDALTYWVKKEKSGIDKTSYEHQF